MSLFDYYMETYNSDVLKEWVDLCGSPKGLTRKADRAEFLARTMTSAVEVRRLWDEMDELSRKAVAAAYHNEGVFNADAFIAQYGRLPERPRRNSWSWYGKPILVDLFIPDNTIRPEVMPLLAPFVPEPERFRLEGVDAQTVAVTVGDEQIPCTIARREEPGRRDLLALLSLANQGLLRFNSTASRLTPKSVELLRGQLAEGDFGGDTMRRANHLLRAGHVCLAGGPGHEPGQADAGGHALPGDRRPRPPARCLRALERKRQTSTR